MGIQQFRRPGRRRRHLFLVPLVLAWLYLGWPDSESDLLDPLTEHVASGEYATRGVVPSGGIDLIVPGEEHHRQARVCLLGVALADPEAAVEVLRAALVQGRVRLQWDRRRIRSDGMLQAYVWVDDLLLNEQLVRLGLATDATHPADSAPIVRRIKKAEQSARDQRRGIWAD